MQLDGFGEGATPHSGARPLNSILRLKSPLGYRFRLALHTHGANPPEDVLSADLPSGER